MPKKLDLLGQHFGKLTVIEPAENISTPNGRSHTAWLCKCECGKTKIIRTDCLRNGHTKSCGCYDKETSSIVGKKRLIDLTGQHFGRLIVIGDSKKRDKSGCVLWECQCSCGNICYVSTSNLKRPKESTISCGCAKSKGEEKIISLLLEMKIPFITQKTFENCINPETNKHLYFDFYLTEYNILIEYDGEQHFHKTRNNRYDFKVIQKRDNIKNQWALDNNIKLIRIPYTDFEYLNQNYLYNKINN